MGAGGRIDRRKHEVDIAERVLGGGVWTGPAPASGARVVLVDLDFAVWPPGGAVSTVQVQRFGDRSDKE
jgi:hypothetical protein